MLPYLFVTNVWKCEFLQSQTCQHWETLYKIEKELKDVVNGPEISEKSPVKKKKKRVCLGLKFTDKQPTHRGTGNLAGGS